MGFILDGVYKDKKYEKEEVSASVVAEIFDIKKDLFPKGIKSDVPVDFAFDKSKQAQVNGHKRCIHRLSLPTKFTASVDGESISITYFEKKVDRKNKKSGESYTETLPAKLTMDRKVNKYGPRKFADKIVYFALHPQCSTSPLHKLGDERSFGHKDYDKEAVIYLEAKKEENLVMSEIWSMPEPILRLRAKGLGVANVDAMSYQTIQANLLTRLERAKLNADGESMKAFMAKWNSGHSSIKGQVQECVDAAYIEMKSIPGGKIQWSWKDGLSAVDKDVICVVERGMQPFDFLLNHLTANWDTYRGIVLNALAHGNTENDESAHENEAALAASGKGAKKVVTAKEVAESALSNNLVIFNPATKGIHYITKDGLDKEPFMVAELTTYMAEFAVELEKNKDLFTLIKQKLQGKAMATAKKDKSDKSE